MLPEHICHVFIHTSLPVKHGILSALVISEYTLLQASEFRPNMLLQTSDLRPAVSTSSTPPLSPVPAFHSKPFFLCASKRGASIVANGSSLISTVALRLPQMRAQIQPKTTETMTPQSPSHQPSFEARLDARFDPRSQARPASPRPISSRFVSLHLYWVAY